MVALINLRQGYVSEVTCRATIYQLDFIQAFIQSPTKKKIFIILDKEYEKMINYVDDALYFASEDKVREHFELTLKNKIHLTLMGEAKWYLGMRIMQYKDYIILDQDQYVKNITTRFEKQFKHPFKLKDSPLPSSFIRNQHFELLFYVGINQIFETPCSFYVF